MATSTPDPLNVFINCPFDGEYLPLFRAIVFTTVRCGFKPRCSLEVFDAAQIRVQKIAKIIKECSAGVHDISRTELDATNNLPRFNMPFELGLYLGAREYGGRQHSRKTCLILDREQYRYQMYLSDIAGQDISTHNNEEDKLITAVRNFLNGQSGGRPLPSGENLYLEYQFFQTDLPDICANLEVSEDTLEYPDFLFIVSDYVSEDVN